MSIAISQILSIVIIVAVIAAAFGGYAIGSTNNKVTPSSLITLTENVNQYYLQTDTVVLYSQSSTTYTCSEGTVYVSPIYSTSFDVRNISGAFQATITTVTSSSPNSVVTTTLSRYFPLTTYTSTINNSTYSTTECFPSP